MPPPPIPRTPLSNYFWNSSTLKRYSDFFFLLAEKSLWRCQEKSMVYLERKCFVALREDHPVDLPLDLSWAFLFRTFEHWRLLLALKRGRSLGNFFASALQDPEENAQSSRAGLHVNLRDEHSSTDQAPAIEVLPMTQKPSCWNRFVPQHHLVALLLSRPVTPFVKLNGRNISRQKLMPPMEMMKKKLSKRTNILQKRRGCLKSWRFRSMLVSRRGDHGGRRRIFVPIWWLRLIQELGVASGRSFRHTL